MQLASTFSDVAERMLSGAESIVVGNARAYVIHASGKADVAMCRFPLQGKWYRAIQQSSIQTSVLANLARVGNRVVRILDDQTGGEIAYVFNGHVVFLLAEQVAA